SLKDWFWENINVKGGIRIREVWWSDWFLALVWNIWKWRNQVCHSQTPWPVQNLWRITHDLAHEIFSMKRISHPNREVELIGWSPPPIGWVKLNVDGSRVSAEDSTAIGGVLRGACGTWIAGFLHHIGSQPILQAELLAIRDGLSWVQMLRYSQVEVESDSLLAVQLVMSSNTCCHPLGTLISDIHSLMEMMQNCKIRHIRREANFVADYIAKSAHGLGDGEKWLSNPPQGVLHLLEADRKGRKYRRGSNPGVELTSREIGDRNITRAASSD
ncbi:Putative ribonuclease H protein At1g65750, partial [Linum grandiflorum]